MTWSAPRRPRIRRPFLLRTLTAARDGLRDELDRFADQLRESTAILLREEAAYDKLIDGLTGEPIHPDVDVRDAVRGIADSIEHENEHSRVVAEHDALENGQRTPRIDTLMKLAAAAEVSPTALLDGIEWAVTRLERPGSFWIADPGTDSWHRWERTP